MTRAAIERHIQTTYTGAPLEREAYHAAAEATLEPCVPITCASARSGSPVGLNA